MKKTLVALAALAATASFAQSSVQIIGVLDIGYSATASAATTTSSNSVIKLGTDGTANTGNTYTAGTATSVANGAVVIPKGTATNASLGAIAQNGVSTSAIKFVGTEDIGGGLKAGFLAEINPNLVRSSTSNQSNVFASEYTGTPFNGEQFLSLAGGFGDVKLGVPNAGFFLAVNESNPFGTALGSGYAAAGFARLGTVAPGVVSGVGSGTARIIRHERAIQYTTPSFNGLTAMITYAAQNDNAPSGNQDGYTDISVMYKNGPLSVAYSNAVNKFGAGYVTTLGGAYANVGVIAPTTSSTSGGAANPLFVGAQATPTNVGSTNGDYTYNVLSANYTMGNTTVYGGYTTTKSNGSVVAEDATSANLAFKHVMGSIDLLGNYTTRTSNLTTANNARQIALGANYNLSKRTSVYYRYENTDYNTDSKDNTVAYGTTTGGALGGSVVTVNMVGIRHAF